MKAGDRVRTIPSAPGGETDGRGRAAGSRGVVLSDPLTTVRLDDGSVLPYRVRELEPDVSPGDGDVEVSVSGLHERYTRGAVWEHDGDRLIVLCSDIRLGMPYVHFMGNTLRGALRDEMTEANGWRSIGKGGA